VKYLIPKTTLEAQIKRVQKRFPEMSRMAALDMLRDDKLPDPPSPGLRVIIPLSAKESAAIALAFWRRHGLNLWRGKFMETPNGTIKNGVMKFDWGPQLVYAGIGQERNADGLYFDGESIGPRLGLYRDGLLKAMSYALKHDLYNAPGVHARALVGDALRVCSVDGMLFSGRAGADTCSARCRKRKERALKAKGQDVTLIAKR
jgi:hypothetical protein